MESKQKTNIESRFTKDNFQHLNNNNIYYIVFDIFQWNNKYDTKIWFHCIMDGVSVLH